MYYNGTITFNNIKSSTLGLIITKPPEVKHSELQDESYLVPGRTGELHHKSVIRGDAEIGVEFALALNPASSGYDVSDYQESIRAINSWLAPSLYAYRTLTIDDVEDSYYKVHKVVIESSERELVNYGKLKVTFQVYPLEYKKNSSLDGKVIQPGTVEVVELATDEALPVYKFNCTTASGSIKVNGNTFTVYQASGVWVASNTNIAYYVTGNSAENKVLGDYTDLRLQKGTTTIETSAGVTLTIYSSGEGWII